MKYLFFDLDGTLTDSGTGIFNSAQYSLESFGIIENDIDNLSRFVGPPLEYSFKEFYGFDDEKASLAVSKFREYFSVKGVYENEVYDGVREMLETLCNRGYILVLATSKLEKFAHVVLKHFSLDKYFYFVGGSTESTLRRTKGSVIAYCLESLKITDTNEVLMIGDKHHDVEGAKENGIDCLGVTYGYGSEEELISSGAKYIAKTPQEVLEVLAKL